MPVTRRRSSIAVSVLIVPLLGAVGSPPATLFGRIVNSSTGIAVVGARLLLTQSERTTESDSEGRFSFGDFDVGSDTLVVRHPDYQEARFILGDEPVESLELSVKLRRRPPDGPLIDITAAAARTGGSLWVQDEFWPFLRFASHPLELLVYSGLVARVWQNTEAGRCVEIFAELPCADIWVDGEPTGGGVLGGRLPAEVAGFVIVNPGVPVGGASGGTDGGVVMVFMSEVGR